MESLCLESVNEKIVSCHIEEDPEVFFWDDYMLRKYLQTFPRASESIISLFLKKILQEQYGHEGLYGASEAVLHSRMEKEWGGWLNDAPSCIQENPFFISLKERIESFYVEGSSNLWLDGYVKNIIDINSKLSKNSNVVGLGVNDAIVSLGLGILGHNVLSTDITRGFLGERDLYMLYMRVGEWIRLHMIEGIIIDVFDANEIESCAKLDIFHSATLEHQGIDCIFLSGTGSFAINKPKTDTLYAAVEETYKRIVPLYNLLNSGGVLYAKNELFDFAIRDDHMQTEEFFPYLKKLLISRLNPVVCNLEEEQITENNVVAWSLYRYSLFLKK